MSEELKTCPFCGMDEPDWCDQDGGDWHFIRCRGCESSSGTFHKTKDEAVSIWNRRTTSERERLMEKVVDAAFDYRSEMTIENEYRSLHPSEKLFDALDTLQSHDEKNKTKEAGL